MRGQFAIEAHRSDSRNCRDFAPRRVGELRDATALPPRGTPSRLYDRPVNNVQQAIRDAAEKGGYRYRWWKANDLEQSEGYNGLQLRALSEQLQDRHLLDRCITLRCVWPRGRLVRRPIGLPE